MRIKIPKTEQSHFLIANLAKVYPITQSDEHVEFETDENIIIPRGWSNLSQNAFKSLCRKMTVADGTRKLFPDEFHIEPKRPNIFKVRLSTVENKKLAEAAKKVHTNAADFIRDAALTRANRLLTGKP